MTCLYLLSKVYINACRFHAIILGQPAVPFFTITYRGFTFHFKTGVLNNDAKLKRIAEVLGIKMAQIEHIAMKENFVPSLKVGHDALVTKIEQSISTSRLMLTGNYFDGMAIEDCVTRSLKEFLRLKKLLGR